MWDDAWLATVRDVVVAAREHVPQVGAAILLLLVGWLLARGCRRWALRLSGRFLQRIGGPGGASGRPTDDRPDRGSTPVVVAACVFWLVLLMFVISALEVVGVPVMTDVVDGIGAFAPNLLAALLIALGGLIAARAVRSAVARAAEATGVAQASEIASLAQGAVIVLVAVIVLEQLGVNGRVLELTIAVIAGSAFAAVALAFGLGARSSVANLIGAHYASRMLQVGQALRIGDHHGTVIEVTRTAIVLETPEGRVIVPGQRLHDTATVIVTREA